MKKKEFKNKLKIIGLNQKKFAELTEYSYSAVKGWEDTPKWVEYVIKYFEVMHEINDLENAKRNLHQIVKGLPD